MFIQICIWARQATVLLAFGFLGACNTVQSRALISNDLSPLGVPGASITGAKFVFDVDGDCPNANDMELMVIAALKTKGACVNGFAMTAPRYSPPSCRAAVQCKK